MADCWGEDPRCFTAPRLHHPWKLKVKRATLLFSTPLGCFSLAWLIQVAPDTRPASSSLSISVCSQCISYLSAEKLEGADAQLLGDKVRHPRDDFRSIDKPRNARKPGFFPNASKTQKIPYHTIPYHTLRITDSRQWLTSHCF
jgi:hypothetical protein